MYVNTMKDPITHGYTRLWGDIIAIFYKHLFRKLDNLGWVRHNISKNYHVPFDAWFYIAPGQGFFIMIITPPG